MNQRLLFLKSLAPLAFLFFLFGCAGKDIKQGAENPDWVQKGVGAFIDQDQQAFYAIGAIKGIENKALGRMAAENRARGELAEIFETYSAALIRDAAASTPSDDRSPTNEGQAIDQAIEALAADTLSDLVIIDHWFDPREAVFYAFARLDLARFKDNTEKATSLDGAIRVFVRENAEKAFNQLETEINKNP